MAFVDQYALANDATFIQRVHVAMMTAGTQVASEAKGGNDAGVYDKRQRLAAAVLSSAGMATLQMFVWAAITNPVITGSSLDSDIQFQVNAQWNDLAAVRVTD